MRERFWTLPWCFTFSKVPRRRITHFMPLTPSGKAERCLRLGPNRRRSGQRTVGQGETSRSILAPAVRFEARQTVGGGKAPGAARHYQITLLIYLSIFWNIRHCYQHSYQHP